MLLVNLLFDARRGWPYILSRQLYIEPNDHLDKMISRRGPKKRGKLLRKRDDISSSKAIDDIFYLPGKIDISRLKYYRKVDKTSEGRIISKRFVVRGHWRKANPTWKDPSLRWIEPYWKGPEDGVHIEKEYRLKP